MGVQIGDVSNLNWLIQWTVRFLISFVGGVRLNLQDPASYCDVMTGYPTLDAVVYIETAA
jgi:hypothetical protein